MDKSFYVQAASIFTLSLLSVSAAYFTGFKMPWMLSLFLPVSILFGYTAYISKEGFNKASLAALPALAFSFTGLGAAFLSVVPGLGPVLVSVFSGGDRFREYYSSTHIPLILLGLIIGVLAVGTVTGNPELRKEVQNQTANFLGQTGERIVNQSNVISSQRDKQALIVEQTAKASVFYTKAVVMNETRDELSVSDLRTLDSAFEKARRKVPEEMSSRVRETKISVDISERVSDAVKAQLEGKHLVVFIPLLVSLMIALQPLVGLLTALSAESFDKANSYYQSSSS
ncbi:MAG: hypothetical protein ABEK00_03325 [Candidatus Nanohaloarchaea archaeon]